MKRLLLLGLAAVMSSCCDDSSKLCREDIQANIVKVADWQLAHPTITKPWKIPTTDWAYAPYVHGLFAVSKLPGNEYYLDEVVRMGDEANWKPTKTKHPANDHATPQTWLELYELTGESYMLDQARATLDSFMAKCDASDNVVTYIPKNYHKWSWCDALYMSPPAYARLAKVTNDDKYLKYIDRWWKRISDAYYDEEYHLFYRDHKEKAKREANGEPVFWSRGEGWVVGGLARMIEYLPQDYERREFYVTQFQQMCTALAKYQQPNGLWAPGILDPETWSHPETSGSGLIIYAMAWGVNNGFLNKREFMPTITKGWLALSEFVQEDGKFVGVQPIGESPASYDPNYTLPYGSGAYLLAASEVYKLAK